MIKNKMTRIDNPRIYAAVMEPREHAGSSHLAPALKRFFERLKERGIIDKYVILDEKHGIDDLTECGQFLALGRPDLEEKMKKSLKECKQCFDGKTMFGNALGDAYCYGDGARIGKAAISECGISRLEEFLGEEGFAKDLKGENTYVDGDDHMVRLFL